MDRIKQAYLLALLGLFVLVACNSADSNQTTEQAAQSNAEQQLSAGDIDTGE